MEIEIDENLTVYYIMAASNLFGVIANLINISVFLNPKMKEISFKYMLANAISDVFLLGFNLTPYIFRCQNCKYTKYYSKHLFKLIVIEYFGRVLTVYTTLSELFLSIKRYSVLKNKPYIQEKNQKVLLVVLLLVSFVYYIPIPLSLEVTPVSYLNQSINVTSQTFVVRSSKFGLTTAGKVIPIVLQVFRFFLGSVVITALNVKNMIEFRKRYGKKLQNVSLEMSK